MGAEGAATIAERASWTQHSRVNPGASVLLLGPRFTCSCLPLAAIGFTRHL